MVYDDTLDLCWLQDAGASGPLTWDAAVAWADSLVFGGWDDWRLPQVSNTSPIDTLVTCRVSGEAACISSGNELGYMYYHNLTPNGDTPPTDENTPLSGNQGPFIRRFPEKILPPPTLSVIPADAGI